MVVGIVTTGKPELYPYSLDYLQLLILLNGYGNCVRD
jgi:hypothetical protein